SHHRRNDVRRRWGEYHGVSASRTTKVVPCSGLQEGNSLGLYAPPHRLTLSSLGVPLHNLPVEDVATLIRSVSTNGAAFKKKYPEVIPPDCRAGPSARAPPNNSEARKHRTGSHRAKMTSATAIKPCPLDRPSFQLPGKYKERKAPPMPARKPPITVLIK